MPDTDPTQGPTAVIGGWIGAGNLGDELIHAELRRGLRTRGVGATAISEDPDDTRARHGDADPLANALRRVPRAGGVVLGGGGLLQDATSTLNVVRHGLLPFVGRVSRRPGLGIGLGLGPLTTPLGRRLTGGVLESIRGPVVLRDADSVALARSVTDRKIRLGTDLVLGLDPPAVERRDEMVVSLRRALTHRRVDDDGAAAVEQWASTLDAVAEHTGLRIRFVAMDLEQDTEFHARIAERLHRPHEVEAPALDDLPATFAAARLVVAVRYHAAVLGAVAGTPVITAPYAPKVRALVDECGWLDRIVDPADPGSTARAAEVALGAAPIRPRERLAERLAVNERALDEFAAMLT